MSQAELPAAGEFLLEGAAGQIEAWLELPQGKPRFAGLVCHPHPLQGGTFNNKVVTSLARGCRQAGGAALRFNFRGVGKSEGIHDGGQGETEDACLLTEWLRKNMEGPLWLAGFSFGSMVAMRAAAVLAGRGMPVSSLLLVAPPVAFYDWPATREAQCPVTIIQGEEDEVVDVEAVAAFAEKQSTKPAIIRVADCSHFFHGRLNELVEAATTTFP